MKLYVCWGTFPIPLPGGHPCRNALEALKDAGWNPEVVTVRGHGVGPLKWMTDGRKTVEELSGQAAVPVLLTDDHEVIAPSSKIVSWAEAHPTGSSA